MATGSLQPASPRKWHEIWLDVWSHPGLATFQALLNEPDHSITRGLIWIVASSLMAAILTGISSAESFRSTQYGGFGFGLFFLCIIILTPIFSVIGIIIATAIYHGISRLFGGSGLWGNLMFCQSAISAPTGIIVGVIELLGFLFATIGASPMIYVAGLVSFGIGIYGLILYVYAIRAVENIGTGQAVLTVFIPAIVGIILAACIALAVIPTSSFSR